MLTNLKNEVVKESIKEVKEKCFYILNGYSESWTDENKQFSDDGLKNYLTELRYKQYKDGKIDRVEAVTIACKRMGKQQKTRFDNMLTKIMEVENAEPLEYCNITVEWVKSATWGNNPHAETRSNYTLSSGTASGCGYDKESAAIAEALNCDYSVLQMLYNKEEQRLTKKENISRRDFVGYGSGYGILPSFEGGVGVSSHRNIFEKCGYTFETVSSGKTFDVYNVTTKDKTEVYTIQGVQIDIDNKFRFHQQHEHTSIEVRLIDEYLSGNSGLQPMKDFSSRNLKYIKNIVDKAVK